jgi:hypothetical protein
MRYYLIVISLLVLITGSCNDENRCYEPVDTLMVTSFSINGFKQIDTLIINGVNRFDVGDTLVNDKESALTKRYTIPLSLTADSTGLVLKANRIKDTLYIRHTMVISFISENCGFAPDYVITGFRYTKGIDSVKITDTKVNPKSIEKKINDQNISIYLNSIVH